MGRDEVSETQRRWRKWYQEHPTVDLDPNYIPPEYQTYLKNDKLSELQKRQKEISSTIENKQICEKTIVYKKVTNNNEEILISVIGILLILISILICIIIYMII